MTRTGYTSSAPPPNLGSMWGPRTATHHGTRGSWPCHTARVCMSGGGGRRPAWSSRSGTQTAFRLRNHTVSTTPTRVADKFTLSRPSPVVTRFHLHTLFSPRIWHRRSSSCFLPTRRHVRVCAVRPAAVARSFKGCRHCHSLCRSRRPPQRGFQQRNGVGCSGIELGGTCPTAPPSPPPCHCRYPAVGGNGG